MRYLLYSCAVISTLLFFYSCMPQDVNHDLEFGGVGHSNLLREGGVDQCKGCHGDDLRGKEHLNSSLQWEKTNGCYECHGSMWNLEEHGKRYGRIAHRSVMNHAGIPASANCGTCHGVDLRGEGEIFKRPSCYECHGDTWSEISTLHVENRNGRLHGTGLYTPETNCISCHGPDLRSSGSAPSCTECHGEIWKFEALHTVAQDGVLHAPQFWAPETNCIGCHGSDLRGGIDTPSCYECHGNVWDFAAIHTEPQDGILHGSGLNTPRTNCVDCHGSTLRGMPGTASTPGPPSCYICHGNQWD